MENRTKPSPSPRPLPRGEGEHANASSRFGEFDFDPTHRSSAHCSPTITYTTERLGHSAPPDEPSGSPSPLGRGRGEGEGISLSFAAFFAAAGSGLNSTENSEEPKLLQQRLGINKQRYKPVVLCCPKLWCWSRSNRSLHRIVITCL
jgi:hypothetical protein